MTAPRPKQPILERLDYDEGRVVSFSLSADNKLIKIQECCDMYFEEDLTKEEFGMFIAELTELHGRMLP